MILINSENSSVPELIAVSRSAERQASHTERTLGGGHKQPSWLFETYYDSREDTVRPCLRLRRDAQNRGGPRKGSIGNHSNHREPAGASRRFLPVLPVQNQFDVPVSNPYCGQFRIHAIPAILLKFLSEVPFRNSSLLSSGVIRMMCL